MMIQCILRQSPIHQAPNHAIDDIRPVVCIFI